VKFGAGSILILTVMLAVISLTEKASADDLLIWADYASFKYSDSVEKSYVEIYYSLLRNQYDFQPDSTGYHAYVDMTVIIATDSGLVVDSSGWRVGLRANSLIEAGLPNFLNNDIISAQCIPGNYVVTLKATNPSTNATGEKQFKMVVPAFNQTDMSVSQIQFAYNIVDADNGPFVKGGKKIIPDTRRIFSHDDKIAYFYGEVYNLDTTSQEFAINLRIFDGNGNLYKDIPPLTQTFVGRSATLLNGFNISAFRSGFYRLLLTIAQGDDTAFTEKYFEITPGKLEWDMAHEKQELADFPEAINITNEDEARKFRNEILYIAGRDELKQYDALTLAAKNNFARAFWQKRDPDPSTPVNEFKTEHFRRFKFANEAYSSFSGPNVEPNGWKTDMGRVYIVYGPPSDEENHQSSMEELPWKRWNYDKVEGGVYFIFLDASGYGDYKLIHSTARNERKDENWEYRISPSTTVK